MVEEQSKTSVDYFNSSSLLFNNQWLLVETRTTKSLIPMTDHSLTSPSSCLSVQVSASVVATSPTQMEVSQSVQIDKWIITTISIFSPLQNDSKKCAQQREASPTNISQLNQQSPQKTKSKNLRNTHQKYQYPDNHNLPVGESDSILIKKNASQKSQSVGNQINLINLQDCNQLSQQKISQNGNQDYQKKTDITVIEEEDDDEVEEKLLSTTDKIQLSSSKCNLFKLENNNNLPQQQAPIMQLLQTPIKNEGNVKVQKKNINPQYFESLLQAGLFSSANILDIKSEGEEEISSNIFSYESDKIQSGKVPLVKKTIAKSQKNLSDRFSVANSAIKLPNNVVIHHPPLRKSSSSNSLVQFSSSPNLTCYNTNNTCSRKQSTNSSSIGIDSEVNIEFKRDRKNLVKNFVKAFRSFVCSEEDESEVREALYSSIQESSNENQLVQLDRLLLERRKELNTLVGDTRNFNNSLMVSIIKSQLLQPLLSYFLTHKAVNWIETSKIKDKQSHLMALRDYQSSMSSPQTLAKLRCLKYRSASNIEQQQPQQLLEQSSHANLFTVV